METKVCNKCNAQWIEGQLYWRTGKKGREEDLAGLVCDQWGNEECINSKRGTKHKGDTWEKRREFLHGVEAGMKATQKLYEKD